MIHPKLSHTHKISKGDKALKLCGKEVQKDRERERDRTRLAGEGRAHPVQAPVSED